MVEIIRINRNEPNNITQFANLIFGITFIQWLSTLSHYLNNYECIGWILTFLFATVYISAIILFEKMDTIKYSSRFFETQRSFNICGLIGIFILVLFYITDIFFNTMTISLIQILSTIGVWLIFIFIVIPSLEIIYAKKEGTI